MSPFLLALVVASTALDLGLSIAILWLRSPARWYVAAIAAVVALVKAAVLTGAAGSLFLAIHLAYLDLVVVLPLAAAAALVLWRKREVPRTLRAVAWLALVVPPAVGYHATFVEPFRLVEERVSVRVDPRHAPAEPLRIAVLSDLQSRAVDDHLRDAVRRAMAFEPHLILLPGDLIQHDDPEQFAAAIPQFRELLSALHAPLGAWFVLGNTDGPWVAEVFEGTDVTLLVDQVAELELGGKKVLVGGAGFGRGRVDFAREFDRREGDELRILVAHYPDPILSLGNGGAPGIDLMVAGHTHGGQVVVPWFGPPITLSRVPREVAAGGLHEVRGRRIYVSRGVGAERGAAPRIRFNCPPEVSLLTIEPAR